MADDFGPNTIDSASDTNPVLTYTCPYKDKCRDYPSKCDTCKHGKVSYYEPYVPYYPTYPYYPYYTTAPWLQPFTIICNI